MVSNLAPHLARQGIRINAICPGGINTEMTPSDVKETRRLSPPSFIADVLVDILEESVTGLTYVAMSNESGGVWRHDPAPIAPPPPI